MDINMDTHISMLNVFPKYSNDYFCLRFNSAPAFWLLHILTGLCSSFLLDILAGMLDHTIDLICIFPMTNKTKHCSHTQYEYCTLGRPFGHSVVKFLFRYFIHFSIGFCIYFLLTCRSPQYMMANIFSHSMGCLFTPFMVSADEQTFVIFNVIQLVLFSFVFQKVFSSLRHLHLF